MMRGYSAQEMVIQFTLRHNVCGVVRPLQSGLCCQRMAGDAPCKHFYTRLCCATLHTHFALSLFVKLSLAIFIPVAPP